MALKKSNPPNLSTAAAEDAMAFDSIIRFEVATNTLLRIE
jgi:hypothetical protein